MRPKLVIVDLDGTVVPTGGHVRRPSPAVVAALASARAAGAYVSVATGRALWETLPTIADLGLDDGVISVANGATVYDIAASAVVSTSVLDPGPAIRRVHGVDPTAAFAVESGPEGWYHTANFVKDFPSTWAAVRDVEQLAAMSVTRLAVQLPAMRLKGGPDAWKAVVCPEAARLAAACALDPATYQVDVSYNGWIDIGPPGVHKASGTEAIARHYGISAAETVVFGDGTNDLQMFGWAGHAVAMGQAAEQVKAAAHEVAPSVDEDGVAAVLRRWFP